MARVRRTGQQRGGASQSRLRPLQVLQAWWQHHRRSAGESLARLLAAPLGSALSGMVIGIAMALPVGMLVALDNADTLSSGWDSRARLSLFLRPEMSDAAAQRLTATVKARHDVGSARLVTRQDALEEFRELSGFGDVLRHLDENPLPNLVIATPAVERLDAAGAARWRDDLAALPGVDRAVLDMAWVQRLNAIMDLGRRLVLALGALFGFGVLLVVGNTIRLAIENRREEILVVKLVGGSDAFVRRPFLYTGLWYGLMGAAFAWLLVSATLWWLEKPLYTLLLLYQSGFRLQGLGAGGAAVLLGMGCLLGLLGAWLAVARHLSRIQPR
jgi:cell division transport system permease protein